MGKEFCNHCEKMKGVKITDSGDLNAFKIEGNLYIITSDGNKPKLTNPAVTSIKIKAEPNVILTDTQNGLIQKHGVLSKKKLGVISVEFTE